jgi:hypothetical protein
MTVFTVSGRPAPDCENRHTFTGRRGMAWSFLMKRSVLGELWALSQKKRRYRTVTLP